MSLGRTREWGLVPRKIMGMQSPPSHLGTAAENCCPRLAGEGGGLKWSADDPPSPASELWRKAWTRVLLGCDLCHTWHRDLKAWHCGAFGEALAVRDPRWPRRSLLTRPDECRVRGAGRAEGVLPGGVRGCGHRAAPPYGGPASPKCGLFIAPSPACFALALGA